VENEAVEQVAFADRILLNKTDLVSEDDLERVEGRLRAINQFAPVHRTVQSNASVESVLDIHGFDLTRTLEMSPEFLSVGGRHQHDASVTSLSIVQPGELDFEMVQDWVHTLLQTRGPSVYRMKGVLSVAETRQKFVFQAVHMIFKWVGDESWGADEPRVSKLVLIGRDLDHAALRAGFAACVVSAELAERKAARRSTVRKVCQWAEQALPAVFAGTSVTANPVRSPKPACPIETAITVLLPMPKEFTLPKPLEAVTREDVAALMQAWSSILERGREVQAWAEQALPKAVAGQRVTIDEIESTHVNQKFETSITVLASPPWSMKVLKRLEDVTQQNVIDVMTYAALCGAQGVPSVR